MSHTDLRDFYPEYTYTTDQGVTVQIEKLGGGTLGKSYPGTWRYIVTRTGRELARGQDLETPIPHTHKQAAVIVADYFTEDDSA